MALRASFRQVLLLRVAKPAAMRAFSLYSRPLLTHPRVAVFRPAVFQPRRTLFIQTQNTPNPRALKFFPGKPVLGSEEEENASADFQSEEQAKVSPLAFALFQIEGVTGVMLGTDFVTVVTREDADWLTVKPHVFAAVSDFYESGKAVMSGVREEDHPDTVISDHDDEDVATIKDLIKSRVRPSVQEDGGDITFRGFIDGVCYVQLQGSCVGCPSSSITLRNGLENMLKYYVPSVTRVEEWVDPELSSVSTDQLNKLEQSLKEAAAGGADAAAKPSA